MKTIFALLLILCAFTSAQCVVNLNWTNCIEPPIIPAFTIDSLTLDADPVVGKNSTLTICGHNTYSWQLAFRDLHLTSGTILNENFLDSRAARYNVPTCFVLTFKVPKTQRKTLPINVDIHGLDTPHVACLDANLTLSSKKNKFLEKFF